MKCKLVKEYANKHNYTQSVMACGARLGIATDHECDPKCIIIEANFVKSNLMMIKTSCGITMDFWDFDKHQENCIGVNNV